MNTTNPTKILIVEDDEIIASGVVYSLESEGFAVTHCADVKSSIAKINDSESFDLAILDLSLPDGSGFNICPLLKERRIPVIFLTAVDDEGNTVKAFDLGADDYITKPFRVRELQARIKAVLRRNAIGNEKDTTSASVISCKKVEIHTDSAKVFKNGEEILLTSIEYKLLLVLFTNKNAVLSRNQILQLLWDDAGNFVNDNTLSVYIKRLREKLGGDEAEIIQTIRGLGYKVGD